MAKGKKFDEQKLPCTSRDPFASGNISDASCSVVSDDSHDFYGEPVAPSVIETRAPVDASGSSSKAPNTADHILCIDDADFTNKLQTCKVRLLTTIDAEHLQDRERHINALSDQQGLESAGAILTGLLLDKHKNNNNEFKARKVGGSSLGRHKFRPGYNISVLMDMYYQHVHDDNEAAERMGDGLVEDIGLGSGRLFAPPPAVSSESAADAAGAVNAAADGGANEGDATAADADGADEDAEGEEEEDEPGFVGPQSWLRHSRSLAVAGLESSSMRNPQLAAVMEEQGLSKFFDGTVTEVHDDHILIKTRYDDAWKGVESTKGSPCWVMYDSMCDTTFRRQRDAANSLRRFLPEAVGGVGGGAGGCQQGKNDKGKSQASTGGGSSSSDASYDELAIVRIVASDASEGELVRALTACKDPVSGRDRRVAWLGHDASVELNSVLLEMLQRGALNAEQYACLLEAVGRRMTLLQGPPGTGKSSALACMVKAFCRVFHNRIDTTQASPPFTVPSHNSLQDWSPSEVRAWVASFSEEVVDPQMKRVLLAGLEAEPGRVVARLEGMTSIIQRNLVKVGHGIRAWELAQACVQILQAMFSVLKTTRLSSAYKATRKRDMRILVAADTNGAIDNILANLHRDEAFRGAGYTVVRLGDDDKMSDRALAARYSAEALRRAHILHKVGEAIQQLLDLGADKGSGTRLAQQLRDQVVAYGEQLKQDANERHELSAHQAQSLCGLGAKLILDHAPSLHELMSQLVSGRLGARPLGRVRTDLKDLKSDLNDLALCDIIMRAQVVLGTCTAVGELRFFNHIFNLSSPIVIIDEAGQSSECSTTIPLTQGAEWVLMAADLKQLRPVLNTPVAKRELGYYEHGGSLYGRLEHTGLKELMLVKQYRMHPAIREFASDNFYGGLLEEDGNRPPDMRIPQASGFSWPTAGYPVAFLDVDGRERRGRDFISGAGAGGGSALRFGQDAKSSCNLEEASVALRLLLAFGADPTVKDIVILSPYKNQVELLQYKLKNAQTRIETDYRPAGRFHAQSYAAYTIDGYQGREADVVIITTVRNNGGRGHSIGFVSDPRRLNVAITRAKRGLVVVGSKATLASVEVDRVDQGSCRSYWPRFISHVERRGGLMPRQQVVVEVKAVALPEEMAVTEEDVARAAYAAHTATSSIWSQAVDRAIRVGTLKRKGKAGASGCASKSGGAGPSASSASSSSRAAVAGAGFAAGAAANTPCSGGGGGYAAGASSSSSSGGGASSGASASPNATPGAFNAYGASPSGTTSAGCYATPAPAAYRGASSDPAYSGSVLTYSIDSTSTCTYAPSSASGGSAYYSQAAASGAGAYGLSPVPAYCGGASSGAFDAAHGTDAYSDAAAYGGYVDDSAAGPYSDDAACAYAGADSAAPSGPSTSAEAAADVAYDDDLWRLMQTMREVKQMAESDLDTTRAQFGDQLVFAAWQEDFEQFVACLAAVAAEVAGAAGL